jgi:pimeloyl-ACP methyl ester carboxylesterase
MKQIVGYKSGNALSYSEFGDMKGYPILIQHGMIASICDYHLFDSLIEAKKRLICIARPGYGESSPYQMENIAEWGKIVSILVDNLGLTQFDILGISSGAPYSYSIGYRLQDRIRSIFIFSGTPALFDDRVLELWPYPTKKNASIAEMKRVAKDVFFSNVTKEDILKNDIRDSMMNDCFGIAQDLRIRCMDWGFRLSEIRSAVYMEHSRTDKDVPFDTAEMTAKMLPNCQMKAREGDHFSEETLAQFIKNSMLNRQENQQ